MSRIVKRIKNYLHRTFDSPITYARYLGVSIGSDCKIGYDVQWPSEPYLITIGSHVQVTNGVMFHTHGGANVARKRYPDFDCFGKIVVSDWAYIGAGSQIMPGVTISEGTLVAAGSIVTKSTPPYSVVGGNPAKVICTVDEYINRNSKYNLGTRKMNGESKKEFLLGLSEDMFVRK